MSKYIPLLQEMIVLPSFSGGEEAVAQLLEKRLQEAGLPVHRKALNLWLDSADYFPEDRDKKTLLLNAHIDTVKPSAGYTRDPFAATLEGGRLYGLGSNDDGGSVIALLEAWEQLTREPQPCRLIWSATAEEENGGKGGLEVVLPEWGSIAAGIFGEPTGLQMALAERGLIVLDCCAHGVAGHAAREEGVNAIYQALQDIEWFRRYQFEKVSPWLGPVKMSVTMIQAGSQHNVVPDTCRYVVDIRPNGLYSNEQIVDTIREHVRSDVTPRSMRHRSSHIDASHPLAERAKALGLRCYGSPTTSNQNLVDFPSVKIGPGESSRSHRPDEYILLEEIDSSIDLYVQLVKGLSL